METQDITISYDTRSAGVSLDTTVEVGVEATFETLLEEVQWILETTEEEDIVRINSVDIGTEEAFPEYDWNQ